MPERGILRTVEYRNRALIEHGNRSLIDLGSLRLAQIWRGADVGFFRTAIGVSREVIPGYEQVLQYRIGRVHASVDYCNGYSGAGDVKRGLGCTRAYQLIGRLCHVSVPYCRTIVRSRLLICQVRGGWPCISRLSINDLVYL